MCTYTPTYTYTNMCVLSHGYTYLLFMCMYICKTSIPVKWCPTYNFFQYQKKKKLTFPVHSRFIIRNSYSRTLCYSRGLHRT